MRKWLVGIALATLIAALGLLAAATIAARRVEPYLRTQVIEYLGSAVRQPRRIVLPSRSMAGGLARCACC